MTNKKTILVAIAAAIVLVAAYEAATLALSAQGPAVSITNSSTLNNITNATANVTAPANLSVFNGSLNVSIGGENDSTLSNGTLIASP